MSILEAIRAKASKNLKRIVLPESEDFRALEAVSAILDNKIARAVMIGEEGIRKRIKSKRRDELELIDPKKYKDIDALVNEYYEARKHKGMTPAEARKTVLEEYLTFGCMLVRRGLADGFVAGADHTTPDVVRTALRCIPIDRDIGVVSGAFLMEIPNSRYGEDGVFIFNDCAVNPAPGSDQLAGIAASSARLFSQLIGKKPVVAFLSYSSKGSAAGPLVEKVASALKRAKEILPGIVIDGELQVDSAIVPEVARIKCPESEVAGRANVLIFPDLNAGNISYKLVQRLANARAVGPLLLGFTKPCSDLSRGCSVDDIVDAVAVTALRA